MRIVPSHFVPSPPLFSPKRPSIGTRPSPIIPPSPSWPICFFDQVPVVSAGEQSFRSEAFKNNTNRPIEIHSMRVLIQAVGTPPRAVLGQIIALDVVTNGIPITAGPVIVTSMCRSDNRLNDTFAGTARIASHIWFFSNPMPLDPGKTISVRAKHLGVVPQSATVSVSFAGRVATKPPLRRFPFAAAWSSRSFAYAETASDISPPGALGNDTKRDINIQRIIGRSVAYDDSSGAGLEIRDFSDISLQGVTSLLLRLGVSQDRPILKTYTPWRAVFGQNAAVETDFALKPGDNLIADVRHVAGPALTTPFTYSQTNGIVSIVGWREA